MPFDAALLVDGVLVFFVLEVVALAVLGRRWRLPPLRALLPNLTAGLFLVLALRSAVHQDGTLAIAAFLALGGLAHAVDLRARARR